MIPALVVIVDDERTFAHHDDAIYLRTADEALAWFARWHAYNYTAPLGGEIWIDRVYFDHDLGPGDDAAVVAKFLAAVGGPVERICVHSQNPAGADNIVRILDGIFPKVSRIPLPELR